jgi:hypothetical protein
MDLPNNRWRRTADSRPCFGRAVRIGRWIGCQRAFPAAVAQLDDRLKYERISPGS